VASFGVLASNNSLKMSMKWFSSAMLGVLASSNLGFGLALAKISQTFG
jgi:hypothetical protein